MQCKKNEIKYLVCTICWKFIGVGNKCYICIDAKNCDFTEIVRIPDSYCLCSDCFYLSSSDSDSFSSSFECIKFSLNTIKQNIKKDKKINLCNIYNFVPDIINKCLVYILINYYIFILYVLCFYSF